MGINVYILCVCLGLFMCMSERVYIYIYILGEKKKEPFLYREGEESNVTCIQDSMLYRLSSKILLVYFH